MKTWTPDASQHFESWLGRVRSSVAGDPAVDPEDVTQDLRAHVHAELATAAEPVTVGDVERVLVSLGTPAQWSVNGKEQPKEKRLVRWERDVMAAVRELQQRIAITDVGMPLLVGVLAIAGLITLYDGPGILLLAIAYFVARSLVTYAPEKIIGRRRWFVYLPLAIGAGSLTALVLYFPVMLEIGAERGPHGSSFSTATMWVLGLWWIFVGFIARRETKRVRTALKPFADNFDASHARLVMLVGAAFMIAATVDLFPRYFL